MSLLDSRTATIFLLSKNGTKYYYNTLKQSITLRTGETISNLSYFISLDNDTFDDGFNLILNSKNVDNNIKNKFKLINQQRGKQKSTLYNDKAVENEALKAAVLTQIDSQDALWKNINSEDPNFLEKVQDYNIEQKGLREESMLKNQFNTQVSNYYQNSSDYYNSLKLNHKNEYIKDVQDEKILQDIRKNEMLVSDIMTKEREIQLARYAYFQKKRVNQYVNILILISGLCIIILAIGKIKPDLNKFIIIICLTVVLLLGLIIIIGNLVRDSRRYSLDYDEINFKPWNKPK
jgi:hypothetical protein